MKCAICKLEIEPRTEDKETLIAVHLLCLQQNAR
jgi:hypothetical protein